MNDKYDTIELIDIGLKIILCIIAFVYLIEVIKYDVTGVHIVFLRKIFASYIFKGILFVIVVADKIMSYWLKKNGNK